MPLERSRLRGSRERRPEPPVVYSVLTTALVLILGRGCGDTFICLSVSVAPGEFEGRLLGPPKLIGLKHFINCRT